jgi:hypothetical protein
MPGNVQGLAEALPDQPLSNMPRPLERNITTRIIALLQRVPHHFVRKMHGNRMQGGGIPDLYFTCEALRGHSVWIEVKRPGEVRTPLQIHTGGVLQQAGCEVLVVESVEEVREWLSSKNIALRPVSAPSTRQPRTTRSRSNTTGSISDPSTPPRTSSSAT